MQTPKARLAWKDEGSGMSRSSAAGPCSVGPGSSIGTSSSSGSSTSSGRSSSGGNPSSCSNPSARGSPSSTAIHRTSSGAKPGPLDRSHLVAFLFCVALLFLQYSGSASPGAPRVHQARGGGPQRERGRGLWSREVGASPGVYQITSRVSKTSPLTELLHRRKSGGGTTPTARGLTRKGVDQAPSAGLPGRKGPLLPRQAEAESGSVLATVGGRAAVEGPESVASGAGDQPRRALTYHPLQVAAIHADREMLFDRMSAKVGGDVDRGTVLGEGIAGEEIAGQEIADVIIGEGTAGEEMAGEGGDGHNSKLEVEAMYADNEMPESQSPPGASGGAADAETAGEEIADAGTAGEEIADAGTAGEEMADAGTAGEEIAGEETEDSETLVARPARVRAKEEVALMHAAREALLRTSSLNSGWAARHGKVFAGAARKWNARAWGHSPQEVGLMHRARESLELRAKELRGKGWKGRRGRKGGHHKKWGRRGGGGKKEQRRGKDTRKGSGERIPLRSFRQALRNGFMPWPRVSVSAGGKPSSFGFVATKGAGLVQARVNARTCFLVSAWAQNGSSFDRATAQNAFFLPFFKQNSTVLVGGVQYLPAWSFHRVCYTLPTPGQYSLLLRLLFVNTADLVSRIDPRNGQGYANYTVVLRTYVNAFAPSSTPSGSPPKAPADAFLASRTALPVCTSKILMDSWNAGFWVNQTWYPSACRLKRLGPRQIMQCFNGRNVAIAGDSEMRILFGVLQKMLNSTSRADFIQKFTPDSKKLLDLLGFCKVPIEPKSGPAMDPETGKALVTKYELLGGKSVYNGGSYGGFTVRRVRRVVTTNRGEVNVDFNLTYATYFNITRAPFDEWMWDGQVTAGGASVGDGGVPFDMLAMSNQIHAVQYLNSQTDLEGALRNTVLPRLKPLLKKKKQRRGGGGHHSGGGLFMFGALSCFEPRKLSSLYRFGNPRMVAFDALAQRVLGATGAGTFLQIHPITAPRPDLALEATHYGWPVTLAMLDSWLGSSCKVLATAT